MHIKALKRSLVATFDAVWRTLVKQTSVCVLCGYAKAEHNLCLECAQACATSKQVVSITHIKRLHAGYLYQFPLHLLLYKHKYGNQQQLATALAYLLLLGGHDLGDIDCVMPIPLHPNKLRKRGFNQSLLLARAIAKHYKLPLITQYLVRLRDTAPQAQCSSQKERFSNVSCAFGVMHTCPERVLLVDDVVTTGATVSEVARTLKKHGSKRVDVLALCVSAHLLRKASAPHGKSR